MLDKFAILDVIDLVQMDHRMDDLYHRLLRLRKSFSAHEKIAVVYADTDYFYHHHLIGFALNNVFNCWRQADLPFSAMLLLANHHRIREAVTLFDLDIRDQPTVVTGLFNVHTVMKFRRSQRQWQNHQLNLRPQYAAVCLNGGVIRPHRTKIMQYVIKHDLASLVHTSYGMIPNPDGKPAHVQDFGSVVRDHDVTDMVYSKPHRSNMLTFKFTTHPDIMDLHSIEVRPGSHSQLQGRAVDQFYDDYFLDIVSETVFDSPHVFISEKTLRPLAQHKPFVIYAVPGTLSYLRQLGFRTFGDFWDESYDQIADNDQRFLKVSQVWHKIVQQPLDKLQHMQYNMQAVLKHNHQVLTEHYMHDLDVLDPVIKIYDTNQKSHSP